VRVEPCSFASSCQFEAIVTETKALSAIKQCSAWVYPGELKGGVRADKLWGVRGVFTFPTFTGVAAVKGTLIVHRLLPFAGR
jgi:dipeptide/tripeptide permease